MDVIRLLLTFYRSHLNSFLNYSGNTMTSSIRSDECCLAIFLIFSLLFCSGSELQAQEDQQALADYKEVVVSEQALQIHSRSYVFDGHNDLPWQIREKASRSFEKLDIAKPQPELHTDIERLHKGVVGAQFWSVYVPASDAGTGLAHQHTLEQIEIVNAMVEKYPDVFQLALTSKDIEDSRAAGKIASLIGVEGGHAIENSLEKLRRLFKLGARYMTLTHSQSLDWANSCSDDGTCPDGLNEFGKAVVREMNRLGMLVDISHVSPVTMQAALDVSEAPVIFSHSSAKAVADHPRNVPDQILKQLPKEGGVVMVNFYSGFVEPTSVANGQMRYKLISEIRAKYQEDPEGENKIANESARVRARYPVQRGSVYDVVDHIEHIAKVAGIDHVGLGGDYDGVDMLPRQLEDVSTYPVITQVLLDRGFTEPEIHKVMSGNILRVIREAEAVSARMSESSQP